MTQLAVLLALTGLRVESEILQAASACASLKVICAASDPGRARRFLAEQLNLPGACRLLSFGLAGGLAPELPAGSIVIADQVFVDGIAHSCDGAWVRQLAAALPQARVGAVQGVSAIAATVQDKQAYYQKNQALACDMESPVMAEAAARDGLPLACLRVVCDPADFALPPAALQPFNEDGAPQLPALLRSLLAAPGQLPALLTLRRHYQTALDVLAVAARAVV